MKCKKCGSSNVDFRAEYVITGTTVKHTGLLTKLGRALLVMLTCGLWLLVPKKKETSKTKTTLMKVCTCRKCGYAWKE